MVFLYLLGCFFFVEVEMMKTKCSISSFQQNHAAVKIRAINRMSPSSKRIRDKGASREKVRKHKIILREW